MERLEELGYTPELLESAEEEHRSDCDGEPSVYCGTYAKYNDGNLCGLWIDVSSFDNYDDFIDFCKAIHADEDDPELMFHDYESFHREWYDECPDEDSFDNIIRYAELCEEHSKDAVDAFIGWGCEDLEHFSDCYCGKYDSEEDYARELVNECYDIEKLMGNLAHYFDDGYVFRPY